MEKLDLMVDMDDVLYQRAFKNMVQEYLDRDLTTKEIELNGYYLQNAVLDPQSFYDYFFTRNMYDYSIIAPHSQEVLKELINYYNVYILTAYTIPTREKECAQILKHKFVRLVRDFPFLNFQNILFVNDKSKVSSDILIDDRLLNLVAAKRKILFSSYHNLFYQDHKLKDLGVERARDWLDVGRILIKK